MRNGGSHGQIVVFLQSNGVSSRRAVRIYGIRADEGSGEAMNTLGESGRTHKNPVINEMSKHAMRAAAVSALELPRSVHANSRGWTGA